MPQYPANQPIGFSYAHIYGAGTTQVRAGGGLLQSLIVNVAPSGGTVTLYNNTVGSGAAIAAFTFSAGVAGLPIPYGIWSAGRLKMFNVTRDLASSFPMMAALIFSCT